MLKHYIFILLVAGFMNACGTTRLVNIESSPQGAGVIADGKYIGDTPLQIDTEEIFPPRWIGGSYIVKGNLSLEKQGCSKLVMSVDDSVLSRDIKKELQCNAAQKQDMGSIPDKSTLTPNGDGLREIEARLIQVEELFTRGVINKEEYEEHRRRILNDI